MWQVPRQQLDLLSEHTFEPWLVACCAGAATLLLLNVHKSSCVKLPVASHQRSDHDWVGTQGYRTWRLLLLCVTLVLCLFS